MSKKNNKITGNLGEDLAYDFLIKHHYQVLERNFKSYRGEIDIIALDNGTLVFVEVKTRTQPYCGHPAEAVTLAKQKQLYKVAEFYLYLHHQLNAKVRFDVIELFLYGSHSYRLNHLQNAILDCPL